MLYGPDGRPIQHIVADPGVELMFDAADRFENREGYTEITRSYSYKMSLENYGGPRYESIDLFCSQKVYCRVDEAVDASLAVYGFCRLEVIRSANEIKTAIEAMREKRKKAPRKIAK